MSLAVLYGLNAISAIARLNARPSLLSSAFSVAIHRQVTHMFEPYLYDK